MVGKSVRVLGAVVMLLVVLLASGCDKFTLGIATVFRPDGSCEREVHLTAEGTTATVLANAPRANDSEWKTETYFEGEKLHLVATKRIGRYPCGEDVRVTAPAVSEQFTEQAQEYGLATPLLRLEKRNRFFVTDYRYTETYHASDKRPQKCSTCGGTGMVVCSVCEGRGWDQCPECNGTGRRVSRSTHQYEVCPMCGGRAQLPCADCAGTGRVACPSCGGSGRPGAEEQKAAPSLFSGESKVVLPGRITGGDADHVEGQTASWIVPLSSLHAGKTMTAEARRVNGGTIALTGLALLVGAGVVGWRVAARAQKRGPLLVLGPEPAPRMTARGGGRAADDTPVAEAEEATVSAPTGLLGPSGAPLPGPALPDDAVAQAEELVARKSYGEVADLMGRWVTEHPEDARAWELLAVGYFKLSRWASAEEATARVVQLSPGSARAYSNWGATLRKLGRYAEAREIQLRALALDSRHSHAKDELRKIGRDERRAGTA